MLEARGESALSETQAASRLLYQRVGGSGLLGQLMVAACVVAAFVAAPLVAQAVAPGSTAALLVAGAVIGSVSALVGARLRQRDLLRGWQARGLRVRSATSFRIRDAGLEILGEGLDFFVHWGGISELALGPTFWCVIGPGMGFCLPRTFFAAPESERAFIRAVLEHMHASARDRSHAATDFLGVWE